MHFVFLPLLLVLQTMPPQQQTRPGHACVEVRTDVGWVGPKQSFHLIVLITPEDGWHVYWKDSGASGAPTEFEITTPDGFKVGEPIFPRPTVFSEIEGDTFGYNKQVAIFIPVTAPETIETNDAVFEITTLWLACKKICVMGEKQQKLRVTTNQMMQGPAHRDMRLVQWKRKLPKQLSELQNGTQKIVDNSIQIRGTTSDKEIRFIGIDQLGVRFLESNLVFYDNNRFTLTVPLILENTDIRTINGLLTLGSNDRDPCYVVQVVTKPATNHD